MSAVASRLSEAADYGTLTARRPGYSACNPSAPETRCRISSSRNRKPTRSRTPRVVVHSMALLLFPPGPLVVPCVIGDDLLDNDGRVAAVASLIKSAVS